MAVGPLRGFSLLPPVALPGLRKPVLRKGVSVKTPPAPKGKEASPARPGAPAASKPSVKGPPPPAKPAAGEVTVVKGAYASDPKGGVAFETDPSLPYRLVGTATPQRDASGRLEGYAIEGALHVNGQEVRVAGQSVGSDGVELVTDHGIRIVARFEADGRGGFSLLAPSLASPLDVPLPQALYGQYQATESGLVSFSAEGIKGTYDPNGLTFQGVLDAAGSPTGFKGRVTGERTAEAVLEDGQVVTFNFEARDGRFVLYNARFGAQTEKLDVRG